jgi:glycosyltransferase involved in cell wall biosynthesis
LPQFIFISNPINNTGAPVVLLQVVEEYVGKYGANRVRVITPGVDEPTQEEKLKKMGVRVEQAVFGIGFHFIRAQLALQQDDVVIMNTAAVYDTYRDFILLWLRNGRLKHAYWFIHEDIAQLPIIHKEFLDKRNLAQVAQLVKAHSLSLLFPSKRTADEYKDLLQIDHATAVNLRVEVPAEFQKPKVETDFDSIDFLLSGTAGDGRKGQVLAISAFYTFLKDYYEKNPESYRQFTLHLVAVDMTHYISQQIRWISNSTLRDHVKIYESLPKEEAMKVTADCNAVICCSLNETFGLYIAEGMLMGHVVLRNDVAGVDEQLVEGKNGFRIDHTDMQQFSKVLEKILNKKTTNEELLSMSQTSQQIMQKYSDTSYLQQIEGAN